MVTAESWDDWLDNNLPNSGLYRLWLYRWGSRCTKPGFSLVQWGSNQKEIEEAKTTYEEMFHGPEFRQMGYILAPGQHDCAATGDRNTCLLCQEFGTIPFF